MRGRDREAVEDLPVARSPTARALDLLPRSSAIRDRCLGLPDERCSNGAGASDNGSQLPDRLHHGKRSVVEELAQPPTQQAGEIPDSADAAEAIWSMCASRSRSGPEVS
ncbi:hypothetical protein GCM10010221_61880 [Streptomyces parvus]|nr:hypothetical protein GCM10010221_61880 [Streptomyces parvus]